jgi:hypothetical protein
LPGFTAPFTSEQGYTDFFTPASPAAGANYSFTVGGLSADWVRIVAARATLTTDSNVADRIFSLDYIIGRGTTVVRNGATALIGASTSAIQFQWDSAHAVSDWNVGTWVFAPLVPLLLTPGYTVQLTVDNKQVGDTITAISFVFEKFYPDS